MTTTEEIVVCGENFIERRIYVSPDPVDFEKQFESCRQSAFHYGYNRGWLHGFALAFCIVSGIVLVSLWIIHL